MATYTDEFCEDRQTARGRESSGRNTVQKLARVKNLLLTGFVHPNPPAPQKCFVHISLASLKNVKSFEI